MESDKLYRVQKEDLPKVEKMLNQCFAHDPLYETLIPDPEVRKNLMPELFKCDMDEFYATCEIFADSADLNSVLVVSDEAEPYNVFQFYFTEAMAALQEIMWIRPMPLPDSWGSLDTAASVLRAENWNGWMTLLF